MNKTFRLISGLTVGLLALAWGSPQVQADETTQMCVNDAAEVAMHFDVHFKNGGGEMKADSEPYKTGEKCVDIPTSATDVTLNVYRKTFIIWSKTCSKSWPSAPKDGVHATLQKTSSGIECSGL